MYEEAIAVASYYGFGLAAGFWTKDLVRTKRLICHRHTGNVWPNTCLHARYELPFGALKETVMATTTLWRVPVKGPWLSSANYCFDRTISRRSARRDQGHRHHTEVAG